MAWCLLLTGLPNSGKSTLAYHLVQDSVRNALVIDGDRHREMQFLGKQLSFGKEDIMLNTEHVIKMARFAQAQGMNVLISQIAPYREQRKLMCNMLNNFYEVFCKCSDEARRTRPNFKHSDLVYEEGGHDLIIETDKWSIEECIKLIKANWPEDKVDYYF